MTDHQPRGYTNATEEDWVAAAPRGELNPWDQSYFDASARYLLGMAAVDEEDPAPAPVPQPADGRTGDRLIKLIGLIALIGILIFGIWRMLP